MDGQTKRGTSKRYRQEMVQKLRRLDREPPEAVFDDPDEMMHYLGPGEGSIRAAIKSHNARVGGEKEDK